MVLYHKQKREWQPGIIVSRRKHEVGLRGLVELPEQVAGRMDEGRVGAPRDPGDRPAPGIGGLRGVDRVEYCRLEMLQ